MDECRESLIEAIKLILQDRLEDSLKGIPENATKEEIIIEGNDVNYCVIQPY